MIKKIQVHYILSYLILIIYEIILNIFLECLINDIPIKFVSLTHINL